MFLPGASAALLAAAGIFAAPPASPAPSVRAAPKIRIHARGECPAANALTRAFGESRVAVLAVSHDATEPSWEHTVTRDAATHTARLSLRRADGAVAFERDVEGDDCAGIAGVAAVVVEAYFMEIHLLEETAAPEPPRAEAVPAPLQQKKSEPVRAPRPSWFTLSMSGGGVLYAQPSLGAWSGEGGLGVRFRNWTTGVVASYATPTTQGSGADRVRRTEVSLHLDVAYRFRSGRLWVEPGVALYALGSRVTALGLAGEPSTSRLDFGAGPTVVAGIALTPAISLTGAVAAAFLFRRDEYEITPAGVVARSPGERVFLGLGLRLQLPL